MKIKADNMISISSLMLIVSIILSLLGMFGIVHTSPFNNIFLYIGIAFSIFGWSLRFKQNRKK